MASFESLGMDVNVGDSLDKIAFPSIGVVTAKSKTMPEIYSINGFDYNLLTTHDVSDLQNKEVILGAYKGAENSSLLVIGQDGGVIAPVDMSWTFGSFLEDMNLFTDDDLISGIQNKEINVQRFKSLNIMFFIDYLDLNNLNVIDTNNMSGTFVSNGLVGFLSDNQDLKQHEVKGLEKWNTTNVKDMSLMFSYALNNVQIFDISEWDVSNVTNMRSMFSNSLYGAKTFDISKWDVLNVINMYGMFEKALNAIQKFDISKWDVSSVTNMRSMFYDALNNVQILDISKCDVSNSMFGYALDKAQTLNLSRWDVSNITDMDDLFHRAFDSVSKLDLYLNNFEFGNVSSYYDIFRNMPSTSDIKLYVKNENEKQ